jgi:hypothetical protein
LGVYLAKDQGAQGKGEEFFHVEEKEQVLRKDKEKSVESCMNNTLLSTKKPIKSTKKKFVAQQLPKNFNPHRGPN